MVKFYNFMIRQSEILYQSWLKGGIGQETLRLRKQYIESLNKDNLVEFSIKPVKTLNSLKNAQEVNH
jgi:hypothetical protein